MKLLFFILFSLFLLMHAAYAYQVTPLTLHSDYIQAQRITIDNSGSDKLLNYVTKIMKRSIDARGKGTHADNDEDLLIIPPQGTVPAGGRQTVTIRYVGDFNQAESRHYFVNVSQINITEPAVEAKNNVKGVTTLINFLYAYNVGVNFEPQNAIKQISCSDASVTHIEKDVKVTDPETEEVTKVKKSVPHLSMTCSNNRTGYVYMHHLKNASVTDKNGKSHDMDKKILLGTENSLLIPTGLTRNVTIPLPDFNIPDGQAKFTFEH